MVETAAALSRKSLQSGKTSLQLFGSLLEKALQFPGENHVFLVNGKPVITFWGFVNLNENTREEVLDCLRTFDAPPALCAEPEPEDDPVPEITFAQADEPLLALVIEPLPAPEPISGATPHVSEPETPARSVKPVRRLPVWCLPLVAAVIVVIAAPLLWKPSSVVTETPAPATLAVSEVNPLPKTIAPLPLHQAEVIPASQPEKKPDQPVVIAAIAKDALVMDANQMKAGTTRFLNGNWRVILDVKDPITGKAPSLRYQLQNNKGTARVVHGDSIVCRAEVFSGLHQTGELMIKSRGNARCTDGSRYPMPEITCKAGANDVAACTARYDAHAALPLTFKKIGA